MPFIIRCYCNEWMDAMPCHAIPCHSYMMDGWMDVMPCHAMPYMDGWIDKFGERGGEVGGGDLNGPGEKKQNQNIKSK